MAISPSTNWENSPGNLEAKKMHSKTMTPNNISTKADARGAIKGLAGKKCWKAGFAYGGELHLHFGAHVPCSNPRMAGRTKGSWRLGTCGTSWTLLTPNGKVTSGRGEKKLESSIKSVEGATVRRCHVKGRILTIGFDNECTLLIIPTAEDDKYEDVPYWELFMPRHMMVAFGPGNAWSYRRSDDG
ncbi:MAG TPA: hypothetical protein VMV69_02995 [Pirellulales bacterium]|nr:hypothetical protein [Pirellulales bacterium]